MKTRLSWWAIFLMWGTRKMTRNAKEVTDMKRYTCIPTKHQEVHRALWVPIFALVGCFSGAISRVLDPINACSVQRIHRPEQALPLWHGLIRIDLECLRERSECLVNLFLFGCGQICLFKSLFMAISWSRNKKSWLKIQGSFYGLVVVFNSFLQVLVVVT